MLKNFFYRASRVQKLQDGPGGSLLESFAEELSHAGYAEINARRHIGAAAFWPFHQRKPRHAL